MSGTDNIDEDVQMDSGETEVSFDAKPFREPANTISQSNDTPTSSVESNTHTRPGSSSSTAILLESKKYDKCYSMKHKKRGKALIFNMEKFEDNQKEERTGSSMDVDRLKKTLLNLGFDVISYGDGLELEELMTTLSNAAAHADADSDCFIVVFMSHGEADDKLWAKDKKFSAKMLWEPFLSNKCPALVGKPKLFFIQACRGRGLQTSTFVRDAAPTTYKPTYTLPNECDILIAHATMSGNSAARNPVRGTWFIQSLCDELDMNGKKENILSLLTSVNRRVAIDHDFKEKEKIFKQQPIVMYTLTRELFFTDK